MCSSWKCQVEAGKCVVEAGECLVKAGECVVESGECLVEPGECVVEAVNLKNLVWNLCNVRCWVECGRVGARGVKHDEQCKKFNVKCNHAVSNVKSLR